MPVAIEGEATPTVPRLMVGDAKGRAGKSVLPRDDGPSTPEAEPYNPAKAYDEPKGADE